MAKNQSAFEAIYDETKDEVYRYLVHYVGSVTQAEDLFQDVWLKAFVQFERLRDPARARPWIFRIARNRAFDQLRKQKRKGQVWVVSDLILSRDQDLDYLDALPGSGPGPVDIAIQRERARIIQHALRRLDSLSQEIFQLHFFESFVLSEIAEILDVPLGTVRTKVFRGLRALRKSLSQHGHTTVEDT